MNIPTKGSILATLDFLFLHEKSDTNGRPFFLILFFVLVLCLNPVDLIAQSKVDSPSNGRQIFTNHCGRCHGMHGAGGTGPSLQRPTLVRAPDDEALASIIENGIPGTGMPGSWMLSPDEISEVITHVRNLGKTVQEPITGDAAQGKVIFELKGACITCHIVEGKGGSLGPELTAVGLRRGAAYLGEAIQHPGKSKPLDSLGFTTYQVVEAEHSNGQMVRGIRINEDSFSIQIRDAANQIYSLRKRDLKSLRAHKDESLMPSFQETFSPEEIENLVAFLASLKN
jgi:cytochrome c oxidase cbb3-type subunit 3